MDNEFSTANCVECGKEHKPGEGAKAVRALVAYGQETAEVPGLYRCPACDILIEGGVIGSNVTPELALNFLNDRFIPDAMAALLLDAELTVDEAVLIGERLEAAAVLAVALAVFLADAMPAKEDAMPAKEKADAIRAYIAEADPTVRLDEGRGFIFTCPGCGKDHPIQGLFDAIDELAELEGDGESAAA